MDLTFSRTLKKNKRTKITEDCLDNSLLRVNKIMQILNMKVLKRKIPNVSYFYLKEMDTQLFLWPSILSDHYWTLVIRSEFFVQSSFSISVLALPEGWINYLITWNFLDMFISRFWYAHISWHLNFVILRKFYIFWISLISRFWVFQFTFYKHLFELNKITLSKERNVKINKNATARPNVNSNNKAVLTMSISSSCLYVNHRLESIDHNIHLHWKFLRKVKHVIV